MKLENKYCYNKMLWLKPNKFYADILQDLYCGKNGEIQMSMQFFYESFTLLPYGDKLGKVFDEIASEDFLIAKTLAETIVMLGGNPVFNSKDGEFFNGKNLSYSLSLIQLIDYNISQKENAVIAYKMAKTKIDNKYIHNLFNSIIQEEELHLKNLKEIKAMNVNKPLNKVEVLC